MEKELKLLLNELDIDTEDAGVETNLNEIGVDSIVMMQFIVLIEEKYGIEIVERVPIQCGIGGENIKYMQTKKQKLGHFLDI